MNVYLSSPRGLRVFGLGLALGLAGLGLAPTALAQEGDGSTSAAANADMDEASNEEESSKPAAPSETRDQAAKAASPAAPAAATEAAPLEDYALEHRNDFVRPAPSHTLEWHGGLEADGGYASYTFERDQARPQGFYDTRGRFVVGPPFSTISARTKRGSCARAGSSWRGCASTARTKSTPTTCTANSA